jgi:hypothetical protein
MVTPYCCLLLNYCIADAILWHQWTVQWNVLQCWRHGLVRIENARRQMTKADAFRRTVFLVHAFYRLQSGILYLIFYFLMV